MSYLSTITYKIVPDTTFSIIRNCSGCGCKRSYINTGNFRMNANGSLLDVWLIYQCPECKHTYNLPIYERIRPEKIDREVYRHFLENDEETAFCYGLDKKNMIQQKAEIDWDKVSYHFELISEKGSDRNCYIVQNPYQLKIRPERIAAQLMKTGRNQIKKLQQEDKENMRDITQKRLVLS